MLLPGKDEEKDKNADLSHRTEAQRNYDLSISYIKSDMYEKGLDILNQVAFLYPESDVADNALYQLALIREGVGDGKFKIGEVTSLEAQQDVLRGLTGELLPDVLTAINAYIAGKATLDKAKTNAIAQYLYSLDYLVTLFERYPTSDILYESKVAFLRVNAKIEGLISDQQTQQQHRLQYQEHIQKSLWWGFLGVCVAWLFYLIYSQLSGN